jgi:hypothetical protein
MSNAPGWLIASLRKAAPDQPHAEPGQQHHLITAGHGYVTADRLRGCR